MDKTGLFGGQKALKPDAHFASFLKPFPWSFSLILQAVTPYTITGRKFYCQIHKKNPEVPEKIFRGSRKNFSGFHEKFWPVSRDHFACHFKVIWPVPRFAFVPKWMQNERPFLRFENLENTRFCPFMYFKVPKRTKIHYIHFLQNYSTKTVCCRNRMVLAESSPAYQA